MKKNLKLQNAWPLNISYKKLDTGCQLLSKHENFSNASIQIFFFQQFFHTKKFLSQLKQIQEST